ncbi:MAG: hypothetical protein ACXVCM_16900 [Ktedonobacteraceae bacterium]
MTKMDAQFGTACQLSQPTSLERLQHPARKQERHWLPVLDKPGIRSYTIHIGYIRCG